jgi:hypothetical protein
MTRGAFALAAVASMLACTGGAKREASALLAAVDRYRRADDTSKAAEAQKVAGVACSDSKVCGAKQACLAAIHPTERALMLKLEVERRLSDIEQKRLPLDSPEAQALPSKLDEAERLLDQGRAKLHRCEKELTDLQLEHGV